MLSIFGFIYNRNKNILVCTIDLTNSHKYNPFYFQFCVFLIGGLDLGQLAVYQHLMVRSCLQPNIYLELFTQRAQT